MKLVKIPDDKYQEYRLNLMFDCYKWDPQFLDNNTVAKYALVLTEKEHEELVKITESIDKETIEAENYLNNNLKLAKPLALPKKIYGELKRMNNYERDNFSDLYINVENFKFNKWSKNIKSRFGKSKNNFDYDNILLILDKMNALFNCVKSNRKNGNFNELFLSLAYHFINPSHLYENNISEDGYLSNYYIANKFNKWSGTK